MDYKHYVPILKTKRAELDALQDVAEDHRRHVSPLLEVLPTSKANVTTKQHLEQLAPRLIKASAGYSQVFLDQHLLGQERLRDGSYPAVYLGPLLSQNGVPVIPVMHLTGDAGHQHAAGEAARTLRTGCCVRLGGDDFADTSALEPRLEAALEQLQLAPEQIDILLDMEVVPSLGAGVLVAQGMLTSLPQPNAWRSVILAGSSFPSNLGTLRAGQTGIIERVEWHVWRQVVHGRAPRRPSFGDYAIAHPRHDEFDARFMPVPAQIRYARQDDWFVIKGADSKRVGWAQMRHLCARLVGEAFFAGSDYSEGDRMISATAAGGKTGNAATWRRAGFGHHISVVAEQIANLGVF